MACLIYRVALGSEEVSTEQQHILFCCILFLFCDLGNNNNGCEQDFKFLYCYIYTVYKDNSKDTSSAFSLMESAWQYSMVQVQEQSWTFKCSYRKNGGANISLGQKWPQSLVQIFGSGRGDKQNFLLMRYVPNHFRFQMGNKIYMVKQCQLLFPVTAGPSESPSYLIIVLFIENQIMPSPKK